MIQPYVVPEEALQRGYAEIGDCRPVGRAK